MTYFNLDLNTIWFILVGLLFTGYVVLDGFDLGVGMLQLFTKTDEHRRLMLNAIGPVWDGNEVWLVTGGGALFGAFPQVYATAFSAFYMPFMLLLVALIFRGVAIEFRSKSPHMGWRYFWDICFSLGSGFSAFLIGVTVAHILNGIPLNSEYNYTGDFLDFLTPYALWTGLTTMAIFMLHGAIYIVLKTEGSLQALARQWINRLLIFFMLTFIVFNLWSLMGIAHVEYIVNQRPHIMGIFALTILTAFTLPRWINQQKDGIAFITSCATIVLLMTLFGLTMYPNLLVSYPHIEHTLHIYNGASTQKTLSIMGIFALIGMPLVVTYTICIYSIFRGKVTAEHLKKPESY